MGEFQIENYLQDARDRITSQFKDMPIIDRYLQLLISTSEEIQLVLKDLMEKRSINTAQGKQLDIIGAIVGQDRLLVNVDIFEFFAFLGIPNTKGFGTEGDPSVGSIFFSEGSARFGNIELNDDLYRVFIKAKIAKNITAATPEQLMEFANFIFGSGSCTVQDEDRASFTLLIGKRLSSLERSLLTYVSPTGIYLLPKPLGVRVNYGEYNSDSFFAFAGVPNAKGFGTYEYKRYDGEINYDGQHNYLPEVTGGGEFATILKG